MLVCALAVPGCGNNQSLPGVSLRTDATLGARKHRTPVPRPRPRPRPRPKPRLGLGLGELGFDGALFKGTARTGRGVTDLDRDGRAERWRYRWTGGTGFSGVVLHVKSAGNKTGLSLNLWGSHGRFLTADLVGGGPPVSPVLLDATLAWGFGRGRRRLLARSPVATRGSRAAYPNTDGSFEWLVDLRLRKALEPRAPFKKRRSYQPRWRPGHPRLPSSQVAVLTGSDARRLARVLDQQNRFSARRGSAAAGSSGDRAVVVYQAHNHGPMVRAARCGDWTLHVTNHAVAVQDHRTARWSWAFVSTDVVKLRWRSLTRVACEARRDLLVLERDVHPGRELWVVSPTHGLLGRLPLPEGARWRLQQAEGRLVVGSTSYGLSLLTQRLRGDPGGSTPRSF